MVAAVPTFAPRLPTPTARLGDTRGPQAKRFTNPERSNDLDDAIRYLGGNDE